MRKGNGTVLFRVDAGPAIGSGHFMRCLALAQACVDEGLSVHFLSSCLPRPLVERLQAEDIPLHQLAASSGTSEDAEETVSLSSSLGASWVALDGYQFRPEYHKRIRMPALRLLLFDDCAKLESYHCDCILNQNAGASAELYSGKCGKFCAVLAGTRFALLRNEFRRRAGTLAARSFGSVRKLLLMLGGGDNSALLAAALDALGSALPPDLEIILVPGGSSGTELDSALSRCPAKVRVLRNPPDICSLMLDCDFAVSGGGSSTWEMFFAGLPAVLVAFAENQQEAAKGAMELGGVVKVIGKDELLGLTALAEAVLVAIRDPALLRQISLRGQSLVDGLGGIRVANEFLSPRLRDLREDDCEFVFKLSNEDEVRKASFSSEKIEWESHREWFREKLSSQNLEFYIMESPDGERIGQVRFGFDALDGATISLSMSREFRSRGFGRRGIVAASETVFRARPSLRRIHAFIKPENEASIKAFLKAGYLAADPPEHLEAPAGAKHFVYSRSAA